MNPTDERSRTIPPSRRAWVWVLGLCALATGCDLLDPAGFDREHSLVLVIDRAPGPFGHVTWHADYQGTNCLVGERTLALPFTRLSEQQYKATVPPSPPAAAGGPGEGDRCRWRLVSTSARFAATAAEGDEVFEARLSAEQLAREKPVVLYYWRGTYPRMPGAIITRSLGEPDRQVFRPEFQNQLFTITLTPRTAR